LVFICLFLETNVLKVYHPATLLSRLIRKIYGEKKEGKSFLICPLGYCTFENAPIRGHSNQSDIRETTA